MSSNLPPGVSEGDIPGNRPEDELYEEILERLPDYMYEEIENETEVGKKLEENLNRLIDYLYYSKEELIMDLEFIYVSEKEKEGYNETN